MDYVYAPTVVQVSFSTAPVCNIFESLGLLNSIDELSGLDPWIYETVARLPQHVIQTNHLLDRVGAWHLVGQSSNDLINREFPEYLKWLEEQNANDLRDIMACWLVNIPGDETPPTLEAVYSDLDTMMGQVAKMAAHKQNIKDHEFNLEEFAEVFPLLNDAARLKALLLEHLHWMWDNILREEWERRQPQLTAVLEAYRQLDFHNLTALEAVRTITGRDLTNTDWEWPHTDLVFIPSPHIGPYVGRFDIEGEKTGYVMFGVRQPPQTRSRSPELTRAELIPRLSALADDTRLQILETVAQHDEIFAQDIINLLDLTQSAASRNLRQLVATGYLVERRRETAKCYSINRERVDETMRALRRLLRGKGASA